MALKKEQLIKDIYETTNYNRMNKYIVAFVGIARLCLLVPYLYHHLDNVMTDDLIIS